ncbi:hypothetical protein [Leptolyngbya sp. FACHB-17]|uniref:helix-turn-helix transcriptional regulator n=1 Tax=unclassified Leptolyngbya TaxID=2650499 RepID=UPI0016803C0F|nr:hypothetical protein [Leptolyngbya sp. FACHB-17]MBD2078805.1 hypothetical protein [Leptolyngbya sp. FACHB-17]
MNASDTVWLTKAQALDRTQVSESTLERWIKDGFLLPGIHYGGKGQLRRFDAEMLDVAIRFQNDLKSHEQAISLKRQQIFGRKKAS